MDTGGSPAGWEPSQEGLWPPGVCGGLGRLGREKGRIEGGAGAETETAELHADDGFATKGGTRSRGPDTPVSEEGCV